MKSKFTLSGLLFAGMLASGSVQAAQTVVISFTAKIDQITSCSVSWFGLGSSSFCVGGSINPHFSSLVPIDTIVTGKVSYDLSASIKWINQVFPTEVQYAGNQLSIDLKGFSASTPSPDVSVIDGAYMGWDQFGVWADSDQQWASSGTPLFILAAGFGLYDNTGTRFSDTALPSVLGLSDFNDDMFTLMFANDVPYSYSEFYTASGHLTSLSLVPISAVPEPGSLILFGLALSGLAVFRRRSIALN